MKILVVEDDPAIARMLRRGLTQAEYQVDLAEDGASGLALAGESLYSLIILDVMLPIKDGWQVCEELRESGSRVPILMLTARDGVGDRIRGLDLGADDYLPKPFDFGELLARVRALLRRDRVHRTRLIRVGDLVIDTAQHKVTRAGQEIGLSHREYDLLEALASNESRVLSRQTIQERIWQDEDSFSNTVDVYIGMLRRKIDDPFPAKLIQTVARRRLHAPRAGTEGFALMNIRSLRVQLVLWNALTLTVLLAALGLVTRFVAGDAILTSVDQQLTERVKPPPHGPPRHGPHEDGPHADGPHADGPPGGLHPPAGGRAEPAIF